MTAAGEVPARGTWLLDVVYFADLLEEHRKEWKGADDAPVDPAAEPEVAELLMAWSEGLDEQQADQQQADGQQADGQPWKGLGVPPFPLPVQAAVQRLAAHPGLQYLGERGLRRLARHLYAYLAHEQARSAVLDRVSEHIGDTGEITVLVGHSMGSVVAYEWLHAGPSRRVGTLLTLGSPLGSVPVLGRIRPAPEPGADALAVRDGWVNAANRRDPIAWPKALAPVFGAGVTDVAVPSRVDAHGIATYLASAPVGLALAQALCAPASS